MPINLIDYIIETKGLRQKDLADQLGVSRAQISKWKAGEYISAEKLEKLNEIAGLFGDDPDWAILVKSEENAEAWYAYFQEMNELAEGYAAYLFDDMPELYVRFILLLFKEVGVDVPMSPPSTDRGHEELDTISDAEEGDPLESLILEFLSVYGHLIEWWERNIQCTDHPDLMDAQMDLRHYAPEIALNSVPVGVREAAGIREEVFRPFYREKTFEIRRGIHELCDRMNELRIPFVADYFAYLHEDPEVLDDEMLFDDIMGDSIEKLLPYGERTILLESRKTNELLKELHLKVDALLPEEVRQTLRKTLKWTRPEDPNESENRDA